MVTYRSEAFCYLFVAVSFKLETLSLGRKLGMFKNPENSILYGIFYRSDFISTVTFLTATVSLWLLVTSVGSV